LFSLAVWSQGQENDKGAGGAALSISATAKPASIIALSTNSKNAEVSETNSTTVGIVRVNLQNPYRADIVKQTPDGTLFLNRIEIFVRFSGFEQETATVLITVTRVDDSTSGQAVREGASPEGSNSILDKQIIEVQGVKSGERIVRYVGFLVGGDIGAVAGKTPLGAVVRYQITHP
jgi:hypothetical protein